MAEQKQTPVPAQGTSHSVSSGDCLQLAAETELFLIAVSNVHLSEVAKQSWLLLRLAHEELVTKMLKFERASENQIQARDELEGAYHAVRQAKYLFLQKYKERA